MRPAVAMMGSALAVALVSVGVPLGAEAQRGAGATAVFLPAPGGDADHDDPEVKADAAERHLRAVSAINTTLEREGVQVVPMKRARVRLPADLRSCAKVACAAEVAKALSADFTVVVTVWGNKEVPDVVVTLVTPEAVRFSSGYVPVQDGDLEAKAREAYAHARMRMHLGRGPWVHIQGDPTGATVLIDGEVAGTLPLRKAVTPGERHISVRKAGYEPEETTVQIPLDDQAEVDVQLKLTPLPGTAAAASLEPPPGSHTKRDPLHLWGPLGLGAVGATFLALTVASIADTGCLERTDGGQCFRRNALNATPFTVYASLAVAGLAGAIVWWIAGRPKGPGRGASTTQSLRRLEVNVGPTGGAMKLRF